MTHILIYGCDDGGDMVWKPYKLDCELQSDEVLVLETGISGATQWR